jgi:hypothetical protein
MPYTVQSKPMEAGPATGVCSELVAPVVTTVLAEAELSKNSPAMAAHHIKGTPEST